MGRSLEHANFTFPRGYLFGLTLSTAGSSTTFSVAAGEAVDSTFVGNMTLGSSISKTTSAWAVGSTNGALDTGTIANNTWYHVYLIKRPDTGVVDILISLSATSPTLPSGYTIFRRIGSMKTDGSGNWVAFTQNGDDFVWSAPVFDANAAALGTSRSLFTLSTPPGVVTKANVLVWAFNSSTGTSIWVGPTTTTDAAPSFSSSPGATVFTLSTTSIQPGATINILTDASSRVAARSSAAGTQLYLTTNGWTDTRGKLS